jgi:hypothetical protein
MAARAKRQVGGALMPRLSAPARRALEQAGYTRLEQFSDVTEAELLQLHGVGTTAIVALRTALEENGLSFAG